MMRKFTLRVPNHGHKKDSPHIEVGSTGLAHSVRTMFCPDKKATPDFPDVAKSGVLQLRKKCSTVEAYNWGTVLNVMQVTQVINIIGKNDRMGNNLFRTLILRRNRLSCSRT
jgi:hypothetical protein